MSAGASIRTRRGAYALGVATALALTVALLALVLADAAQGAPPRGKVTICHAAGKAGTTRFVELTVAFNAAFGRGGHFNENGSGRAGHEQDFVVVPATDPSIVPAGIPTATTCPPPPPPVGGQEEAFIIANKLCLRPIGGTFTITIGGTPRQLACGQSSDPVPVPAGADVTVTEEAPPGVTAQFNCFRAVDSQLQTIVSGPGPTITIPGTALTPGLEVFCNVANFQPAFIIANKLCLSPISGTFTITIGGTTRELSCGQSSDPVPVPAGADVTVTEEARPGVTTQFNCFRAVDSQLQTIVSGPGPTITIPGTALTPGLEVFCNVGNVPA